ncbi:hypothetical protein [Embleya sp. AB8]|uniref:hypothetical protein n=1 Tax=Embleya sp. AB8 TaxID=3156304 RepID=UPI003C741077
MRQETDRLREPAAWALVGFLALRLTVDALRVLFGVGSGVSDFRARAYGGQSALLDVLTPALLAAAVLLVTHAGRPTPRARMITRVALGVLGVQGIVGLTVALGGLAYDGGGFADIPAGARVEQSAVNVGVLVLFALCAYFLIVVLGAPSPPTVTRGKSLPPREWPSYGREATGVGQPSGQYAGAGTEYEYEYEYLGQPSAGATGQYAGGDRTGVRAAPQDAGYGARASAGVTGAYAGGDRTGPQRVAAEYAGASGADRAPVSDPGGGAPAASPPASPAPAAPPAPPAPPAAPQVGTTGSQATTGGDPATGAAPVPPRPAAPPPPGRARP